MGPTYEEIIELNSRLKNRPKKEVERLLETIKNKGYVWNDKNLCFHNKKISISVRTQGLDLFDPKGFENSHKIWSDPNYISGSKLGQRFLPKLFLLFIFDLIFGWIFISIKFWLISLLIIVVLILVISEVARKRVKKARMRYERKN